MTTFTEVQLTLENCWRSIILTVVGAFSLPGHFTGQLREGSASDFSLVGGLVLLIPGLVLLVLADLGALPEDDSFE